MAAATIDHRDGKHTTAARLHTTAAHATPSRHAPSGPPVATNATIDPDRSTTPLLTYAKQAISLPYALAAAIPRAPEPDRVHEHEHDHNDDDDTRPTPTPALSDLALNAVAVSNERK